tara:strand:+ start:219 stop:833 length:615 start_codon:yes stop_codon:yes gene_type:complete
MPAQPIFPTPIYLEKYLDNEIEKELWNAFNNVEFHHEEIDNTHDLSLGEDGTLFNDNVLNRFDCQLFLKLLHDNLMLFLDELGYAGSREYLIEHSWFTKTNKGQYAPMHYHGSSDISGVYYLQTNGQDGNLTFYSPTKDLISSFLYSIVDQKQNMPLEQGLLAFWPGLLYHTTETNMTDHERISLSFNIQFPRAGFVLKNANTH